MNLIIYLKNVNVITENTILHVSILKIKHSITDEIPPLKLKRWSIPA